MTTLFSESSRPQGAGETKAPQKATNENSKRQGRRKRATVSWYGRILIIATLFVAAGWELFRWLLMIVTQD